MLRKALAVSLVALAVSPFTAPFETCNISVLFVAGTAAPPTVEMGLVLAARGAPPAAVSSIWVQPASSIEGRTRFVFAAECDTAAIRLAPREASLLTTASHPAPPTPAAARLLALKI
jgi:hypothetical protein